MRLVLWLTGMLVAVGVGAVLAGADPTGGAAPSLATSQGSTTEWGARTDPSGPGGPEVVFGNDRPARSAVAVADPVTVRIESVDITVDLDPLGLNDDGTLEVPSDFERGGWYAGGPRPGEAGPSVVTAHVDGNDGPAPFFRLREVQPGDEIEVERADGSVGVFVVAEVTEHPKDDFPTLAVYGNTDGPELRLITCGGDFDRAARSYLHNVIVWAVPA